MFLVCQVSLHRNYEEKSFFIELQNVSGHVCNLCRALHSHISENNGVHIVFVKDGGCCPSFCKNWSVTKKKCFLKAYFKSWFFLSEPTQNLAFCMCNKKQAEVCICCCLYWSDSGNRRLISPKLYKFIPIRRKEFFQPIPAYGEIKVWGRDYR